MYKRRKSDAEGGRDYGGAYEDLDDRLSKQTTTFQLIDGLDIDFHPMHEPQFSYSKIMREPFNLKAYVRGVLALAAQSKHDEASRLLKVAQAKARKFKN